MYYDQSINNNNNLKNYTSNTGGYAPYLEENNVYNVFSYTQANENNYNEDNINNNNSNSKYNVNNDDAIDIKNKYADYDKLIENTEKSFFETQKLLMKDYKNADASKKKSNI
jgi:hypothetical protein